MDNQEIEDEEDAVKENDSHNSSASSDEDDDGGGSKKTTSKPPSTTTLTTSASASSAKKLHPFHLHTRLNLLKDNNIMVVAKTKLTQIYTFVHSRHKRLFGYDNFAIIY